MRRVPGNCQVSALLDGWFAYGILSRMMRRAQMLALSVTWVLSLTASAALASEGKPTPSDVVNSETQSSSAIDSLRARLTESPTNAMAHNELGVLLVANGDVVDAERHLWLAVLFDDAFTAAETNNPAVVASQASSSIRSV